MNKLQELEAFVAAASLGSFAKAAREQNITPAMLGRRVSALEERLGVRLLHRTTRRLTLTEQGELFLERSGKVLADLESAEAILAAQHGKIAGHLRVFAPPAFGRMHVLPLAGRFGALNPGLTISVHLSLDTHDPIQDRFDVGILIRGNPAPDVVATRLATNRKVVCGSPEYFRKHGVPRTPDDLLQHNCFPYVQDRDVRRAWVFRVNGRTHFVHVKGNLGYNGGEASTRWSLEGLGLAWRSTWEIQRYLDDGRLVTVLEEFEPDDYDILAIHAPHHTLPLKIEAFIRMLQDSYSTPNYFATAYHFD